MSSHNIILKFSHTHFFFYFECNLNSEFISFGLFLYFLWKRRSCDLHITVTLGFFLTLSKVEKCLCIRFVCLSVRLSIRALTLVNILQMSWNWYMLFISGIAWSVLKIVYIRRMVCLQRHTKVFRYITVYGEKRFKAYFNMFIWQ